MDRLIVKIDFIKLRVRLEAERGCDVGPDEVKQWLEQTGFARDGDWQCPGASLRHLRPDELIATRGLFTEDGITFVDPAIRAGWPLPVIYPDRSYGIDRPNSHRRTGHAY